MRRLGPWLAALGLLLTLGLTYSPSFSFRAFVYDGGRVVEKQPVVRGDWSLHRLLHTDYWGRTRDNSIGSYRPFAVASLWIDYHLFGPRPDRFAWTQLLWMLGVCLLVVAFARRLGVATPLAWLAGFLFAVHPVHTPVVASVAGRADLLVAFLFLAALWLHQSSHPLARPLNLFVIFLGLCSKELFVVFPAAALLLDLFGPPTNLTPPEQQEPTPPPNPLTADNKEGEPHTLSTGSKEQPLHQKRWTRLRRLPWFSYGMYGLLVVLFFWLRHSTIGTVARFPHGFNDNPLLEGSVWVRLLNAPMLLWRYVEILVLPTGLSPDRTYNAVPILTSPWAWRFWAGLGVLVALGGLLWWKRRHPILRTLILLGLLLYLPLSNTLVAGPIIMADRWLFLVSIPFCIGLAMGIGALFRVMPRLKNTLAAATAVLLLALGGITYDYTVHWRSSLSLFRYAVAHTPQSLKARYIYGKELLWANRPAKAVEQFRAALGIKPDFALGTLSLAEAYEKMGKLKRAESLLREQVRDSGLQSPNARIRLVLFLRRHGRLKEAQQVDRTIRRDFADWLKMMRRKVRPRQR